MPLPAELIDHIFSFLQKDTLALEACSKADPLFSRLAERHLYAHINIGPVASFPSEVHLILENPRLLDHPQTLVIRPHLNLTPNPLAMSIVPILPRMANLVSLNICDSFPYSQKEEFFSTFRNCLQQSSFQQLYLSCLYDLPFSVLDDAKNIKQLTLLNCTADGYEPISSSPSSQLSLETLVLSGYHNTYLHRWAMRWVTRLTTLNLQYLWLNLDWTAFSELLGVCSNSLTNFILDMDDRCYTMELPFTLSALMHLERVSISALITSTATEVKWALPEIIRVLNTAPAINNVDLRFQCYFSDSASLTRLDWSLLDHLQSNSTGKRPRIDLLVIHPKDILDALAANEALMDLVKRGLVILRLE